jgi:hypothetical protein
MNLNRACKDNGLGSAGILPALSGILPETAWISCLPSGWKPSGAGKMPALPEAIYNRGLW